MIIMDMYGYNCLPPTFAYLDQAVNLLWIAIVVMPPFLTIIVNKKVEIFVIVNVIFF